MKDYLFLSDFILWELVRNWLSEIIFLYCYLLRRNKYTAHVWIKNCTDALRTKLTHSGGELRASEQVPASCDCLHRMSKSKDWTNCAEISLFVQPKLGGIVFSRRVLEVYCVLDWYEGELFSLRVLPAWGDGNGNKGQWTVAASAVGDGRLACSQQGANFPSVCALKTSCSRPKNVCSQQRKKKALASAPR